MNNFRLAMLGAAAAAIAYGAPVFAQGDKVVEEIEIVHKDHSGHDAKPGQKSVEKTVKRHRIGGDASRDRAALEAKCGARKFETSAVSGTDQDKRQTKIKLCGAEGESAAEWAKTLNDALARLQADSDLPAENKAKMAAELQAEIARLN